MVKYRFKNCDSITPVKEVEVNPLDLLEDIEPVDTIDSKELMDSEDFINRRIYIWEDITDKTPREILRLVMRYNMMDDASKAEERLPIRVYINTDGGDVIASLIIAEIFAKSKTPVYTYNVGYCFSGGTIIFAGGHKRYTMRNSYFMIHDGSTMVSNTTMKVVDARHSHDDVRDRMRQWYLDRTTIDADGYDNNIRADLYLTSEEAIECGLAHEYADDIADLSGTMDDVIDALEGQLNAEKTE